MIALAQLDQVQVLDSPTPASSSARSSTASPSSPTSDRRPVDVCPFSSGLNRRRARSLAVRSGRPPRPGGCQAQVVTSTR